jgi:uncharacterized protein (DUF4415 family)
VSNRMGSITAELVRGNGSARETESRKSTDSISPTSATEATSATKRGGRPRRSRPAVKVHLSIDADLVDYMEQAWRAHRRKDGSYVKGPSGFVEDLLTSHRAAAAPKRG